MRRPLNPTAAFIRPLFAFPIRAAVFAAEVLWQITVVLDHHGRGSVNDLLDLYCCHATLRDLQVRWEARRMTQESVTPRNVVLRGVTPPEIPTADLAPVLLLAYQPQESPKTHSNGFYRVKGTDPYLTPDRPANTILGGRKDKVGSGKGRKAAVGAATAEPLYIKRGKRYVAANGEGADVPRYRKVGSGKQSRYKLI